MGTISPDTVWDVAMASVASAQNPLLRLYTKILVVCTAFLVFKGALVTSHGAGLAVPDWPQTFGYNMFLYPPSQWTGGIFYEHVHRLVASGIGFLTLLLALWLWRAEGRRWVRLVGYGMLVAVILQGILGGLTVLYNLPAWLSSAHGILGQTFFALTVLMAYAQSRELAERPHGVGDRPAFYGGLLVLGAIYVQLTLGAFMRHTESGLALLDFPTMAGGYSLAFDTARMHLINQERQSVGLMPVEWYQVALHVAHRIWGIVVFFGVLALFLWSARRVSLSLSAKSAARFLWILVCCQVVLGIFTILSMRNPTVTSFHVAVGAIMIGVTLLYMMRVFEPQQNLK